MASKETQELIIEALNFYMESIRVTLKDNLKNMDVMRKLVKLDDIKKGLEGKTPNEE